MKRGCRTTMVALAVAMAASSASAEEPAARVASVAMSRCAPMPFDENAFASLLSIEIANDGYERAELESSAAATSAPTLTSLHVYGCGSPNPEVLLRAGAEGHVVRERRVDLSDVRPEERPRVLAIAMAELMRAADTRIEAATASAVAPPVAPPPVFVSTPTTVMPPACPCPPSDALEEAPKERAVQIGVVIRSRVVRADTPMLGLGALGLLPLAPDSPLVAKLELGAESATTSNPIGDVTVRFFSGSLALLAGEPMGETALAMGPRVEVGYAHASGETASAGVVEGAGGGGVLVWSVEALLTGSLGPVDGVVSLDAGWASTGTVARVDGHPVIALDGPHVGVRLGVLSR